MSVYQEAKWREHEHRPSIEQESGGGLRAAVVPYVLVLFALGVLACGY